MKIRATSILKGGEVLAEPVFTKEKEILIPGGTVLKAEYIPLILSLGIDALMIEDPYKNYESPTSIINEEKINIYVNKVQKIIEGHIYHGKGKSLKEFEIIANDIVKDINELPKDTIIDLQERNPNLYYHTVMVTLLSVWIARKLKLDRKKQYSIAVGCLLHDIGIRFITVPYENIDFKKMDAAELFEYKKHTILGYSALEEESWIPPVSMKMVLSHHENGEGSGFPMKQKVREVECRIIQVCDALDGYISGMECRRISVQEALDIITSESDKKYDSKIVEQIMKSVAKYPVGTTVETNDKIKGIVVSQTCDPDKPVIIVKNTEDKILEENKLNLMLEKDISILRVV